MTEVNYILTTMTSRSLIIIDELCRSTSVEEGTAIAMVICEDLARSGAYTYVTTHFTLLTKLADLFFNIKVWQMQTIPSGDPNNPKAMKLDYKFNLVPGTTTLRGYGIYMVRNIWPARVLQYVDEFQRQLTKTSNDPKFSSLDKRVRLKYDLKCKLKKLKLQKKLTVANLNKHIDDYNNEIANMGETPYNSQVVWQNLHSLTEEDDGFDHSIFDASRNNAYSCPELETSKLYLENIEENNNAFHIYPEEKLNNSAEVVLSPVSSEDSLQNSITSPSQAKQRMQEIFTPDTNLDNFQSQSTYHSMASNQNFGLLAPEVHLSCSVNECSLNLTKNALNLEEDQCSQAGGNVEDQQITNTQQIFYEAQSPAYSDPDRSRNLFKGSQNIGKPIVSFGASQVSSCDLSQQLEMIREQRRNLTFTKEPSHPLPEISSELTIKNSEIESPFINTFVRPLQTDITKTSTPLITKIKHNARNFESSSTSTPVQNKTQVTTPKLTFTILNRIEDVDMESIREDLESFVEDMQNEDFPFDDNVASLKGQTNDNFRSIIEGSSKDEDNKKQEEIINEVTTPVRTTDPKGGRAYKDEQKHKNIHLFPAVKIIEGPNYSSFEEDTNSFIMDKETLVQPIVRNPQPQPSNQEKEDVLIKAFNSLSGNLNEHTYNKIQSECHIDNNLNNNLDMQHWHSSSKIKTVNLEQQNIKQNVDILTEAFNSLSKPRSVIDDKNASENSDNKLTNQYAIKHGNLGKSGAIQSLNDKNIDQVISSNDLLKSARDVDVNRGVALESIKIISNSESKEHVNIFTEIEENSTDCYESARSSPDAGYSPSSSLIKGSSEESLYHVVDDCEEQLEDKIDLNKTAEKAKISDIERVEKVIELTNEEQKDAENNCEKDNAIDVDGGTNNSKYTDATSNDSKNLSNFYKPILNYNLQKTNESIVTDYEKSTEKFPMSGQNNSVERDGTETEKVIQKNLSESNYDTVSQQENDCSNKRELSVPSNLSAESERLSIYGETAKNPAKSKRRHAGKIPKKRLKKKRKLNIYKNLSAECENLSDSGNAKNPIAFKSLAINEEELSNDNASSNYVSVTDVIQTVDIETLNSNKYQVEQCEEALQKEKELMEKIKQMKNTTKTNVKDGEHGFKQGKPHIPYLSAYSNCSSSLCSDKENKVVSTDSIAMDLNKDITSQIRKPHSRKPTLEIAGDKRNSKDIKLRKISKTNSENKTIGKENIQPKEVTQSTETVKGSVKNASSEKDAVNNTSSERSNLEEITQSDRNEHAILSKNTNRWGSKRKKLSQNESTSHSTQNRIIEEKTITSISEASKLRNLEGDFSSNSSGVRRDCLENAHYNSEDCEERSGDGHQEKTVTSISDASRKRNLDQSTNSSFDKRESQNDIQKASDHTSSLILAESTNQNRPETPKRFSKLVEKETDEAMVAQIANSFIDETCNSSKTDTQVQSKLKFISPTKLSKKAIQEAFHKQDRKFFESSGSSTELAKMWEQRLRRPTVRQIQRSTCLATIRKTEEGVEVIPEKEKTKRRYSKKEKILSSSSSSVNMNIFSDKNAKTFDMFIKSDKKDFKSFNFNFGYGEANSSRNDGKMFNFRQVSSGRLPSRKSSEEFLWMSQQSSNNPPFLTQNADFSLTPEGFYKQNRDDISQLVKKYN